MASSPNSARSWEGDQGVDSFCLGGKRSPGELAAAVVVAQLPVLMATKIIRSFPHGRQLALHAGQPEAKEKDYRNG
jgi:hypothetical protein